MQDPIAEKSLRQHFNSKSRSVKRDHDNYLVPLKYDPVTGAVLTEDVFDARKHYKKLNLNDWAFLECWMKHGYNDEKAKEELGLTDFNLKRLVKKCEPFKAEESRDKVLAKIPTPTFIQARHTENILGGIELDDSDHRSLQELAKISGAYKPTTNLNVNVNAFVRPQLTPEQEKAAREFFDTIAINDGKAA